MCLVALGREDEPAAGNCGEEGDEGDAEVDEGPVDLENGPLRMRDANLRKRAWAVSLGVLVMVAVS